MMLKTLLAILFFALLPLESFASKGGADSSGGGGGVKVGEAVYLYDLYDAGLQDAPYFGHKANDYEFELELNKAKLPEGTPTRLLTQKLQDFEDIDVYLTSGLIEAMKVLSWRLVDQELERSEDFGSDVKTVELLQLALRKGSVVQIQRQLWMAMNDQNRAALIIHETLAALQPLKAQSNQGPLRRLVAWLFDEKFYDWMLSHGQQAMTGFPSFFEARALLKRQQPWSNPLERHNTRVFPVDLGGGQLNLEQKGRFMISPHASFTWSGQSENESTAAYMIPGYFGLPMTQFCDLPKRGAQLRELEIEYYTVTVQLTSYQVDGATYPMLSWGLTSKHLMTLVFGSAPSKTKASCSPLVRKQLETMRIWSQNVRGEGRNFSGF